MHLQQQFNQVRFRRISYPKLSKKDGVQLCQLHLLLLLVMLLFSS